MNSGGLIFCSPASAGRTVYVSDVSIKVAYSHARRRAAYFRDTGGG